MMMSLMMMLSFDQEAVFLDAALASVIARHTHHQPSHPLTPPSAVHQRHQVVGGAKELCRRVRAVVCLAPAVVNTAQHACSHMT